MRLVIPKPRTWHLLGLVAACAGLISVMQFRWRVEDPGYDLVRRLRAFDGGERARAADESRSIRPRERRAIAPLIELLFDPDPRARKSAAGALMVVVDMNDEEESGRTRAALASALVDADPAARLEIARTLTYLAHDPKAIPVVLGFADDPDPKHRAEVAALLGQFGRGDGRAFDALLGLLDDGDPLVRRVAVSALGHCAAFPGLAPEPLLGRIRAAILAMADDPAPPVRAEVARALGAIGNRQKVEVPEVIRALGDPAAEVRMMAAHFLSWKRSGPPSPDLLAALGRALGDPDPRVRRATAGRIGGLEAEALLPALRALADDPAREVADQASDSIARIEKAAEAFRSTLLPGAIAELGDADPITRALAADRLGEYGPRAAGAVPDLLKTLSDGDAEVRRVTAEALGKLGPGAALARPTLEALARSDPDGRVRDAASLAHLVLSRAAAGGTTPAP